MLCHTLNQLLRVASTTLYAGLRTGHFHFLFDSPFHQGIVTSFVLQAHPQGKVWVGILFFFATPAFSGYMNEGRIHHCS